MKEQERDIIKEQITKILEGHCKQFILIGCEIDPTKGDPHNIPVGITIIDGMSADACRICLARELIKMSIEIFEDILEEANFLAFIDQIKN